MRKYFAILLLLGATVEIPLAAQSAPAFARGYLELATTYNEMRSNTVGGSSFWIKGGSAEIHGSLPRGIGVVADIAGQHTANINSSGIGLDLVTATFGPRYTWAPGRSRYALFGEGQVGEAFAFNSLFPSTTGPQTSNSSLAIKTGGGMNVKLSHHLALRAFDAYWVRTQLPNATANVQNNLQMGAGLVVRFGEK